MKRLVLLAALLAAPAMAEEAFRDAIVVNAVADVKTIASGRDSTGARAMSIKACPHCGKPMREAP